jgi:nucleoside-diphosphate-sugar epimerase
VAPPRLHVPTWVAYIVAGLSELFASLFKVEPPLTLSQVKFFTQNRAFTYQKAKNKLNYNPIRLRQGIRQTIYWYRQYGYLP